MELYTSDNKRDETFTKTKQSANYTVLNISEVFDENAKNGYSSGIKKASEVSQISTRWELFWKIALKTNKKFEPKTIFDVFSPALLDSLQTQKVSQAFLFVSQTSNV